MLTIGPLRMNFLLLEDSQIIPRRRRHRIYGIDAILDQAAPALVACTVFREPSVLLSLFWRSRWSAPWLFPAAVHTLPLLL